jgi:putative membrane protein insertion efficiency factor
MTIRVDSRPEPATSVIARIVRSGFGLRLLLLSMVRAYRVTVSPVLPRACRFEPSCAEYAAEALASPRHGFLGALWLIVKRIARCHPFHPGGYDPLP